jgi:hypothetical protein
MEMSDMGRWNLKKLNHAEVKEQYQVEISNRFVNLDDNEDINRTLKKVLVRIYEDFKESLGHY